MKNIKILFSSLVFLFGSFNLSAQTYNEDASEVDFYVPGILANDAMQSVNFLLCFIENTNFRTFIDKGVYKALIDEAQCETADGADATSDQAAATGSSAQSAGAGGGANQVDDTEYTAAVLQNVTDGNTLSGKGWVTLNIDFGSGTEAPITAYIKTLVSADASATNRFGSFTMYYDLRNDNEIVLGGGLPNLPANSQIERGYLDVDNTSIKYRMNGFQGPPRSLDANLADTSNIQGVLQHNVIIVSGGGQTVYSVKHQVFVNESAGNEQYCQKFLEAHEYTQVLGSWTQGSAISEADLATAISNVGTAGFVETDGGSASTVTGEHCWDLRQSEARRVIYEYGTYDNSVASNPRISLTTPSLSLEANTTDNTGLSNPIWAHASYWGVHVNPGERSNVTDSIQFKNQRDDSDTKVYNLRKNYYEITKRTREYLPLNQLGGVSFQMWVDWQKTDSTWSPKMDNLGFPLTGACNAAAGNCPEYAGTISVSGSTVTFNVTHGMDWGAGVQPFELDTAFSFTAANWYSEMTNGSGWNLDMGFHDPDAHQSYNIPYGAFNAVASTNTATQARTSIEAKIDLDQLEADITAGGAGATGLMCIRQCLDSTNMNTSLAAAFTALGNSANPNTALATPFKDIGPWFKVAAYFDTNGNNSRDGGEAQYAAGSYNQIGGIRASEAATFTVITDSGEKKIRDVGRNAILEYTNGNKTSLDNRTWGDGLGNYRYKEKASSYTVENYDRNFGWAFSMQAVIDSNANKSALNCEVDGGNARGYAANYKAESGNAAQHATGATEYYCDSKLHDGSIATTYRISVKQMPDYRLYNQTDAAFVSVSAPETLVLTVDANNVVYNFPNTNMAGRKFKLKFEGFGELHNLPGRVVNTCTGNVVGRYVNNWNECYRYVHDFTIVDGTVLSNTASGRPDVKVRALRGDEYLKKINPTPSGITYSKTSSDLPAESVFQTLFGTGTDAIGTKPAVTLPSAGSNEASVVHGVTVHTPPAN